MLEALEKTLGIVSTACKKAGISRQTHYDWMEGDIAYKAAVENIEEKSLDFSESKLFELITGVKLPETKVFMYKGEIVTKKMIKHFAPDTAAVIFHLKTKGKKRGYFERMEVGGPGGKPIDFSLANLPNIPTDVLLAYLQKQSGI